MADVAAFIAPIANGVVPFISGGQADATQLGYGFTCIAQGFTSNGSVALPAAVAGAWCILFIEGGLAQGEFLAIFGKVGTDDTINGQTGNTQFDFQNSIGGTIPLMAVFTCQTDGAWFTNTSVD